MGIQGSSSGLMDVKIYPNPTTDKCTVELREASSDYEVKLYNVYGDELLNRTLRGGKEQIDLTGFDTGIYFLKITDENHTGFKKLIKR